MADLNNRAAAESGIRILDMAGGTASGT